MRISIVLILVVTAVIVRGRPHNDGTDHTHSPVIAPDSESVINIEGHNEAAVHHSDVGLGNFTRSSQTDMSHIKSEQPEIPAAETHHSDTYLSSSKVTTKPKPLVGTGHAPIIHVDNSGKSGDHPTLDGEIGSVVSHGPMAKNVDNHEVRHNHDHEHEHGRHGHHDKHSTVNHAPMATEHHPKTGNAHHPQLSKTEPASVHSPMVHPEGNHKTDHTDDALNEHSAVTSTVNHPPLATDHHPPNTMLAHHPSLSKIDVPMSHAPIAIPHGETGIRKRRSGPGGLSTHPKTPPRESIEEYQDSEESEYPSKEEQYIPSNLSIPKQEQIRQKRSKGSNQKSYARKTTTTTTTTTLAPPTELASSRATDEDSSEEHDDSKEEKSEGVREKRSKGSNQKTNIKRLTTTTTTTTTTPPAPTPKQVLEASHRGSSEEQDSREQHNKKPEESEFREKRSKGSNRKPAAYTRTTVTSTTSTDAPITKHSSEVSGSSEESESHAHGIEEDISKETLVREKRSKGSNQKSYARKTPTTTTTTTTIAPTTQESSNPTSLESSEDSESHTHDKPEETEVRSKRSKGSNHSFAKKALTTHNYPTVTSTIGTALTNQDATEATPTELSVLDNIEGGGAKSDDLVVRVRRSKGNYQKTQPRKTTTTTTTTAKPTTSAPSTSDYSEPVSVESSDSSSFGDVDVTSEKPIRDKRSKGSNQNSYAKKHHITTTIAPKAPEPEVPLSNVHHPSLSKTEPLNPAKPEEPIKITKPDAGNPATAPEPGKYAPPPQIIPGSHPLAIPLPTNPPPS